MSAYQNDIKAVAALKAAAGSSWSAIDPESVARMRAQNRFKTGLEIAQYTAEHIDGNYLFRRGWVSPAADTLSSSQLYSFQCLTFTEFRDVIFEVFPPPEGVLRKMMFHHGIATGKRIHMEVVFILPH